MNKKKRKEKSEVKQKPGFWAHTVLTKAQKFWSVDHEALLVDEIKHFKWMQRYLQDF